MYEALIDIQGRARITHGTQVQNKVRGYFDSDGEE